MKLHCILCNFIDFHMATNFTKHNFCSLLVDGVHYFVKKEVAFIDCPMCVSKSMALTLIPEHIKEDHFLEVK